MLDRGPETGGHLGNWVQVQAAEMDAKWAVARGLYLMLPNALHNAVALGVRVSASQRLCDFSLQTKVLGSAQCHHMLGGTLSPSCAIGQR